MKKMMKKFNSLMIGALLTIGIIGASYMNADAATKSIKLEGYINKIAFTNVYSGQTEKPTAYLYTYNAQGNYVGKYEAKVTTSGKNYKIYLGSTKLDDTKVSKVCLQLKNSYMKKYSARYGLKACTYTVSMNSNQTIILSTK